ncbi:AAA family ATPase [Streptomyces sp. NPDC055036]
MIRAEPEPTSHTRALAALAPQGELAFSEFTGDRYSRDGIKESLFDTLGWSDRYRSKEIGTASVAVLFSLLNDTLSAGANCMRKSTFRRTQSSQDFRRLFHDTGARVVQIQCTTQGDVLLDRFAARSSSPGRHPGHCDHQSVGEFRAELLAGRCESLDLPGPVLTQDTTDFHTLDVGALAAQLSARVHPDTP